VAASGPAALTNLIVVAGHAVYVGRDAGDAHDDRQWLLQPFQKGESRFYVDHVRAGVGLAAASSTALLVFSGGQTRREAGPRSEADGYLALAGQHGWWGRLEVAERAATEAFARDSLENLLFGLCRFKECVGRYPDTVTVVSWGFKAARFDLHREALRWPASRFTFVGIGEPADVDGARAGESKTIERCRRDPYGTGADLGGKRAERNPFEGHAPYEVSCSDAAALLRHRGPELFDGALPW